MNNSMRTSIYEDGQYFQNSKKSNISKRQPKLNQDNKSVPLSNLCQKSESNSRLNYNSAPFTPKQTPQLTHDIGHMLSDLDSVNMTSRMSSEHDGTYYPQGHNINYENFGNNIANQCMYNPMDFVPYLYPSNYWPILPNNSYYRLPNMGLSGNIESNQRYGFNSSSNVKPAYNQSNPQQSIQNNRQNTQIIKQNNSCNLIPEAPASGILWNDNMMDKNLTQLQGLCLSNPEYNSSVLNNKGQCQQFDLSSTTDLIKSVSDQQIRNRLAETMQSINPPNFLLKNLARARFFVIKSYSEDDLHRAIKYGVWCSTKLGNDKLNRAYKELLTLNSPIQDIGRLFLFFSVNGSGFFAGIAEMISPVNFDETCQFWSQNKWMGKFNIKWHYVKDVRNSSLRHIRSEANENKPVTNSRDAVEVTPFENGFEFIKVFHHAKHETSVFDDFEHYEQRELNPSAQ